MTEPDSLARAIDGIARSVHLQGGLFRDKLAQELHAFASELLTAASAQAGDADAGVDDADRCYVCKRPRSVCIREADIARTNVSPSALSSEQPAVPEAAVEAAAQAGLGTVIPGPHCADPCCSMGNYPYPVSGTCYLYADQMRVLAKAMLAAALPLLTTPASGEEVQRLYRVEERHHDDAPCTAKCHATYFEAGYRAAEGHNAPPL